jgi:putative resolvase
LKNKRKKDIIKKKGEVMNDLISTAKLLGVSLSTIYRWLKRGKIEEPLRTFGNHRRFNENNLNHRRFNENNFKEKNSKTILYSRVSSYKQKDDLTRQSNKILTFAKENNYKNIELIGSGLNYNKKGFKLLLNKIVNRQINTIIIQHKDRLSRF